MNLPQSIINLKGMTNHKHGKTTDNRLWKYHGRIIFRNSSRIGAKKFCPPAARETHSTQPSYPVDKTYDGF